MDAEQIGRKAMDIASDMCVYTNKNYVTELIVKKPVTEDEVEAAPAPAAE